MGLGAIIASLPCIAYAQDSEQAPADGIDDIVVTAQFIRQNVQDTPIAITAISGDTLEARGITDTAAIGALTPNVQLSAGGAFYGNSLIAFIRGIGQGDSAPATEPGVGVYVDDVFYSTTAGALLDLVDLERVEILRGPQGTLAGKNSIGGAIKLFSARPNADANGYIEVGVGNFDALKIRAASNFTLVDDRLYARVSGAANSRDGHVTVYDFGCLYPGSPFGNGRTGTNCKNGTTGGTNTMAARLALRWLANDDVEINFSSDYVNDKSEAAANTLLATGPTFAPIFDSRIPGLAWEALNPAFVPTDPTSGPPVFPATLPSCVYIPHGPNACPAQVTALGGAFLNDPYASFATFDNHDSGLQVPRETTLESIGFSLNVDAQLSDSLQLQSISGFRDYTGSWGQDQDLSPIATANVFQTFEHRQFSQEMRLNGELGDLLKWTLGGFYFDSKTVWTGRIGIAYGGVDFVHGPDPIKSTSWALFANGIIDITDRLQLATGLRYSNDKKSTTNKRRNPDLTLPGPCAFTPDGQLDPVNSAPNCTVGPLNGVVSTFKDDRIDYRVALSYDLTDDAMVYGSISTGYKSGGVNPRPFFPQQALAHDPEELTTYEIGSKTKLFSNTLRINAAAFLNDYKNIVLNLSDCSGFVDPLFSNPCFLPANAGKAKVKGVELELEWVPVDNLRIDGSYGYLDFEFKEINPATRLTVSSIAPFTPRHTWNLGAQYQIRTSLGTITPRLDVNYQNDIYTEANNTPYNLIDSRTVLNGSIRFTSRDENWSLAIEGKNLTDKLYYNAATDLLPTAGPSASAAPAYPRTVMVTARRNF
jgi:iron complex outermembrane receptor protein